MSEWNHICQFQYISFGSIITLTPPLTGRYLVITSYRFTGLRRDDNLCFISFSILMKMYITKSGLLLHVKLYHIPYSYKQGDISHIKKPIEVLPLRLIVQAGISTQSAAAASTICSSRYRVLLIQVQFETPGTECYCSKYNLQLKVQSAAAPSTICNSRYRVLLLQVQFSTPGTECCCSKYNLKLQVQIPYSPAGLGLTIMFAGKFGPKRLNKLVRAAFLFLFLFEARFASSLIFDEKNKSVFCHLYTYAYCVLH